MRDNSFIRNWENFSKNVDRTVLLNNISEHVENNGFNPDSVDYYKYGEYNIDEESLNSEREVSFLECLFEDVYINEFDKVVLSNFQKYLMKEYFFLEKEQRILLIECLVLFAESLLDLMRNIFFSTSFTSKKKHVNYLIHKVSNHIESDIFLQACTFLPYAEDLPEIIDDIKLEKTDFIYKIDLGFFSTKRLLHLIDYESLLRNTLLKEELNLDSKKLNRVKLFDELVDENILTYNEESGKYILMCEIDYFCSILIERCETIPAGFIDQYLLKYDGTKSNTKYLKNTLNKYRSTLY